MSNEAKRTHDLMCPCYMSCPKDCPSCICEPVVADGPAEGIATRVFDEKLHACSLACDCKKRGQFPCNTCQAAWHQAWDLVEGKIVKPVEPAAPVVSPEDPCEMTDAQYEEYIYGPNRAKWQTNEASQPAPVVVPEIEPAVKLLADVMHLWVDSYIEKSPTSAASSSIVGNTFNEIERLLDAHHISVDYCGWEVYDPKETSPMAPVVVRPEETPKRVQVALERFGWRFKIADDAKAMEFAWNELMDVWDHHSLTAQPAPLPSDQKETPEESFNDLVNRMARDLPEGWTMSIVLERHAGWVELSNPEGIYTDEYPSNRESMSEQMNDALAYILDKAKGGTN